MGPGVAARPDWAQGGKVRDSAVEAWAGRALGGVVRAECGSACNSPSEGCPGTARWVSERFLVPLRAAQPDSSPDPQAVGGAGRRSSAAHRMTLEQCLNRFEGKTLMPLHDAHGVNHQLV